MGIAGEIVGNRMEGMTSPESRFTPSDQISDKYCFSYFGVETEILAHQKCFELEEKRVQNCSTLSGKGNLKKHLNFWQSIETNVNILNRNYTLNNRSALDFEDFVTEAIGNLIKNQCAIEVPFVHTLLVVDCISYFRS